VSLDNLDSLRTTEEERAQASARPRERYNVFELAEKRDNVQRAVEGEILHVLARTVDDVGYILNHYLFVLIAATIAPGEVENKSHLVKWRSIGTPSPRTILTQYIPKLVFATLVGFLRGKLT
jgi:hypothetical protein